MNGHIDLKEKWLKAYEETLFEYKHEMHVVAAHLCSKCILAKKLVKNGAFPFECTMCPETIFAVNSPANILGCMDRGTLTKPESSEYLKGLTVRYNAIVEYHEKAIECLRNMKEFDLQKFRLQLVEINNEITRKHESYKAGEA